MRDPPSSSCARPTMKLSRPDEDRPSQPAAPPNGHVQRRADGASSAPSAHNIVFACSALTRCLSQPTRNEEPIDSSRSTHLLRVLWLVQLHPKVSRRVKECNEPVAVIFNVLRELHSTPAQLDDCAVNVIAVERNLGCTGWNAASLGRVNAKIGFRRVEDQPAITNIGAMNAQPVLDEGAQRFS